MAKKKNYKLYSDVFGIEDASSNLLANDKQRQAESLQRVDAYLDEQRLFEEELKMSYFIALFIMIHLRLKWKLCLLTLLHLKKMSITRI